MLILSTIGLLYIVCQIRNLCISVKPIYCKNKYIMISLSNNVPDFGNKNFSESSKRLLSGFLNKQKSAGHQTCANLFLANAAASRFA